MSNAGTLCGYTVLKPNQTVLKVYFELNDNDTKCLDFESN